MGLTYVKPLIQTFCIKAVIAAKDDLKSLSNLNIFVIIYGEGNNKIVFTQFLFFD